MTTGMGFNWVKQQVEWRVFEGSQGAIDFGALEGIVNAANGAGVNLLFSVVNAPAWAREGGFDGSVGGNTTNYMHNKTMRGGRNIETVQGALGVARKADNDHAGDNSFAGTYVGEGMVVSNSVPINYDNDGNIINYKDLQFSANKTPTHVQDYVSKYYGIDEANLMSKTFAKLREVTLTYDLPTALLKKSFINRASISLIGRNLLYFYKDKRFKDVDLDQYNYSLGATGLQSPTTRRYGLNLNIVF
jgi:hypothetical protein